MSAIAYLNIASGGDPVVLGSGDGITEGAYIGLLHDGPIKIEMKTSATPDWMTVYDSDLADAKEMPVIGDSIRVSNPAARTLKGTVSGVE